MSKKELRIKRANRVRLKLKKSSNLRLSLFRSSKHIYVQLIDDSVGKTLLSASSLEKDFRSETKITKTELSKIVAEKLAKKALEKKISKIYFDRGLYKYHGRVKIFADTLRKNGMDF